MEKHNSADLEKLIQRAAIVDTITRYCTALDTSDFNLLDRVFTPDALLDYTSAGGPKGPYPVVRPWLEKSLSAFTACQHMLTNKVLSIDGETAAGRIDLYNPLVRILENGKKEVLHIGALYLDQYILTGEGWRISKRILDMVWLDGAP